MPASDSCEPQVINALAKAGWHLLKRHYAIRLGGASRGIVFADLLIEKNNQLVIVVEIKCFADVHILMDDLYHAIGQYIIYQNALALKPSSEPVVLALPENAYHQLMASSAIQNTFQNAKIKVVIIDLIREEVVQWIS